MTKPISIHLNQPSVAAKCEHESVPQFRRRVRATVRLAALKRAATDLATQEPVRLDPKREASTLGFWIIDIPSPLGHREYFSVAVLFRELERQGRARFIPNVGWVRNYRGIHADWPMDQPTDAGVDLNCKHL